MIKVEKFNESYIRIFSDKSIEQELSDFFKFRVNGYQYMPAYKAGIFDGFVRLYNLQTKTLYAGLLQYVKEFANRNDYELTIDEGIENLNTYSAQDIQLFADSLNLSARGLPISLRDYQVDALLKALNRNRVTLLSPTASGKSGILYAIMRWHLNANRKILLIVPNTMLVEQMYSDFADYSKMNGFDVEQHVQKLYSGFTKDFTKDVLISTWQSLITIKHKSFYAQFDVAMVDECHLAKAASISGIMEKCVNTKYRIGATGTIDESSKTNKLTLEGLFGPVYQVTTTKKLMDEGSVVNLKIKQLILKYDEETCKMFKGTEYTKELDWLVTNPIRNKFIRNLAISTTGNTLVLFNYVQKHGKVIYEDIKNKVHQDRPVFYIHGGVDTKDREEIRNVCSKYDNAIIVASYATMSTGTNMPSIENIIFAHPSKSKIRNLQSIGRGLRLNDGKNECRLFDLVDDLHWKSWKNTTLTHGIERYKIYTIEQFKIKIIEVELK